MFLCFSWKNHENSPFLLLDPRLPEGIHDNSHLRGAVGHGQHRGVLRPRRTADGLDIFFATAWGGEIYDDLWRFP